MRGIKLNARKISIKTNITSIKTRIICPLPF
jgi:hypothetical protein